MIKAQLSGLASHIFSSTEHILGHILVENGIITIDQLEIGLEEQKRNGARLGQALLAFGFIRDEDTLHRALAGQSGVDYVRLKGLDVPPDALAAVPVQFVTHYQVFPVKLQDNVLTVATSRPRDILMFDELGLATSCRIEGVFAGEEDITEAIRAHYGVGADTIDKMMGRVDTAGVRDEEIQNIEDTDPEASVSTFFNQILMEAYKNSATDIHFEPFADELRVRYRLDGVLYDAQVPKNVRHFKDAIASRIKILSNLDIAEKRLPQDGRFKVKVGTADLDLRVSFLPTPCGESIVLRILNTARLYSLEELGLPVAERALLERLTARPHGIIFLTGPTGSGKTTTLYACLARMNTSVHKIITIEDPIEYRLRGITQVQIHPAAGLTFARGLRSMLRHDPDIMMIGEVRDSETATTAIQVALTGHLVFSTLHTNDAAGGVARLADMGIEPYLITSTVQCFIAQRLVRKLCQRCKKRTSLTQAMLRDFQEDVTAGPGVVIYQQQGCEACHHTGYSGREAIYEFLVLDDELRQMILARAASGDIKALAATKGMIPLRRAGWEKVKEGKTTLEEVIRVTQEEG